MPDQEVPLKADIPETLRDNLHAAFERQGSTIKVGVTRLAEFFLQQPDELQALILRQLRGDAAKQLTKFILRQLDKPKIGHIERGVKKQSQRSESGESRERKPQQQQQP